MTHSGLFESSFCNVIEAIKLVRNIAAFITDTYHVCLIQAGKPTATSCPRGHRKNQDKVPSSAVPVNKLKQLADDGLAKQSSLESQGVKIEKHSVSVTQGDGSWWVWLTDPSLKGPSLLDHGQGGFRMETEKTKRIIGDRAQNSKASLVQMEHSWVARLKSHSTPTSNGNTQGYGHAAKGARDRPAPAVAAADIAKAQLKRKPEKIQCLRGTQVVGQAAGWGHLLSVRLLPWALWL